MLKIIIQRIKLFVKIYLTNKKYKSGTLLSAVPNHFLTKRGLGIQENVRFTRWNVKIGDYCFIGKNTFIDNCTEIGSFCSISFDVKIGLVNHALDHISTSPFFYKKEKKWVSESTYIERKGKEVKIGHDVLISANAIILEGVKIGTGAVIAAGAVVIKDVPPYAIVGGVPAKIIRYRFDEDLRKNLLESEWWKLSKEELSKSIEYFNQPTEFLNHLQK